MRYLLVAADKSTQLPLEVPDDIVASKNHSKLIRNKKQSTLRKPKRVVKQDLAAKKRKQTIRSLAR